MSQIFLSYSSVDRDFAERLMDDLENFYSVWIDREDIKGGLQWEQAIEAAILNCAVFMIIVSPASNGSEWVARETIRAEQLAKYRIPILLNGDLPLRLLDVHYIDFRASYEGGLFDLMDLLRSRLEPHKDNPQEIDRLLGVGVRLYLEGDVVGAQNFIGQALVQNPDIAPNWETFIERLQTPPQADLAPQLIGGISIVERARRVTIEGKSQVDWSVELAAPPSTLEKIDRVVYVLHETFESPVRTVRSRENNFRLNAIGWGTFEIPVDVHFIDGSVGELSYELQFKDL
jgi:hypothetical protein